MGVGRVEERQVAAEGEPCDGGKEKALIAFNKSRRAFIYPRRVTRDHRVCGCAVYIWLAVARSGSSSRCPPRRNYSSLHPSTALP